MQKIKDTFSTAGILILHVLAALPIFIIGVIFMIGYIPIVLAAAILDYIDEIKNGSRYGRK